MNERSELLRAGAERTAQAADRRSDSSEDYALGIPVLALIVLALWRATGWDILVALVVGTFCSSRSSRSCGGTRVWCGRISTG